MPKPAPSIIDAMQSRSLFRQWFAKPWFSVSTWAAWETFLRCLVALPLSDEDCARLLKHTGRVMLPTVKQTIGAEKHGGFREAWVVAGRRAGKSLIASLIAAYLACFVDFRRYLAPGEVGTIAVIAADRKQARTVLRYIKGFLAVPLLRRLVVNTTQDSIELSNGVVIEVHTASFRSVRGYTLLAVICDELAFWRSEESANPDTEIIAAVRPGLATIPNSLLLCISSPYARRGALWNAYDRYFGNNDPNILVWQADSKSMNPTVPDSVIQQAYDEDEASASAEYGAQFRRDIESFVSREAVETCVVRGRLELPPASDISYRGFCDPSGGSSDSMTLAIAHGFEQKAVLDLVREVKPPFSPEAVVKEFADLLRRFNITSIEGDRYGGEWCREPFRQAGINYVIAERVKSDIYLSALPLLNSCRVELLDNPRLVAQLLGLERRTSRSGKDAVDHSPHSHDDLVNAACGALLAAEAPQSHLSDGGIFVGAAWPQEIAMNEFRTWPKEF